MVEVTTKEQLESALQNKEKKILIKGELAEKLFKKRKLKKAGLILGGIMVVGGIALAPFSAGSSLGLTAGGVAMTTGEVAILSGLAVVGLSVTALALVKGYNIVFDAKDKIIKMEKK